MDTWMVIALRYWFPHCTETENTSGNIDRRDIQTFYMISVKGDFFLLLGNFKFIEFNYLWRFRRLFLQLNTPHTRRKGFLLQKSHIETILLTQYLVCGSLGNSFSYANNNRFSEGNCVPTSKGDTLEEAMVTPCPLMSCEGPVRSFQSGSKSYIRCHRGYPDSVPLPPAAYLHKDTHFTAGATSDHACRDKGLWLRVLFSVRERGPAPLCCDPATEVSMCDAARA